MGCFQSLPSCCRAARKEHGTSQECKIHHPSYEGMVDLPAYTKRVPIPPALDFDFPGSIHPRARIHAQGTYDQAFDDAYEAELRRSAACAAAARPWPISAAQPVDYGFEERPMTDAQLDYHADLLEQALKEEKKHGHRR